MYLKVFVSNSKILINLKVPNHESYTQRRAPPPARLLTSRRSAPFPLALGFNAAIPPHSRVQLIARVAPCRALSQVGLPCPPVPAILSQVVTFCTQSQACTGCTLSVTLHSLPSLHVFTSRRCMRNSKGWQTVWGIGQGAANTHVR